MLKWFQEGNVTEEVVGGSERLVREREEAPREGDLRAHVTDAVESSIPEHVSRYQS